MIKRCFCLSWFNQVTPLLCCQMPFFKIFSKNLFLYLCNSARCQLLKYFQKFPQKSLVRVYLCHAARCQLLQIFFKNLFLYLCHSARCQLYKYFQKYLCHAARCPKRRPVGSDPLGANPPPFIKEWWQSWKTCYRQTYYIIILSW